MNKELGTKWFTFYTKIRPLLVCIFFVSTLVEFVQYFDTYISRWWLLLYFLTSVVTVVMSIVVAFKSDDDYIAFVDTVKVALMLETVSMAYQSGVEQYLKNGLILSDALLIAAITLVLVYLVWYRLNVKYFKKRILPQKQITKNVTPTSHQKHGSFNIMSEDIYFDPNKTADTENMNSVVAVTSPPVTHQTSNNQICHKCKRVFDAAFAHCPYCGKKVTKKKHTVLIVLICIILVCAAALFGYVENKQAKLEEIRDNAFEAMYNQDFGEAKYYLDQFPDAETKYPTEYAYIEAGLLMEQGESLKAFEAFNSMAYPVPKSLIDDLKQEIYQEGQSYYHAKVDGTAKIYFNAVKGYKRSDDYITLIKADSFDYSVKYDDLEKLIGFEDTNEIILKNFIYRDKFLEGTWKTQNKSHYFTMKEDGSVTYNLPSKWYGNYYSIYNGIYKEGKENEDGTAVFRFSIVGKDSMNVYCYQNGKTYKLYRQ